MWKQWMVIGTLITMVIGFSGCDLLNSLPFIGKAADNIPEEELTIDGDSEAFGLEEEQNLFNTKPQPLVKNYRPISVVMPDGLKIEGTLYVPGMIPYKPKSEEDEKTSEDETEGKASKSVKPAKIQYPLVILCHSLSGDRWEWKEFPRHLLNAGYAVLAFDLRGHGDSVYQGKTLRVWRQFDKNTWSRMPKDIQHLLASIAKNPEFNMVNTKAIGLMGSSIGANVAVNYASKFPRQVRAMVLLSPGLEYYGIETFAPMTEYENAVFFVASKEDAYAAESAQKLYKFALGKKKIQIYQDLGHGTDMLNNDPNLSSSILDWIREVLPPPTALASDTPQPLEKPDAEETAEKPASQPEVRKSNEKPVIVKTQESKAPVKKPEPKVADSPPKTTTAKPSPQKPDKPATAVKPVVKPGPSQKDIPIQDLVKMGTVPKAGPSSQPLAPPVPVKDLHNPGETFKPANSGTPAPPTAAPIQPLPAPVMEHPPTAAPAPAPTISPNAPTEPVVR